MFAQVAFSTKRLNCGGLGIKNLAFFSRAPRLQWLWFNWESIDRSWKGMTLPCNTVDQHLLSACTSIQLGNGELTSFWLDKWPPIVSLKVLAPPLYKLATKKSISVKEGLQDGKWMRGLQRINSAEQMDCFIVIWTNVASTRLEDRQDTITWSATANNSYYAASAYDAHFLCQIRNTMLQNVWKVRVDGKVQFFLALSSE